MLEISQVFRSEDILVSLMISAIVCGCIFIAEVKQWHCQLPALLPTQHVGIGSAIIFGDQG